MPKPRVLIVEDEILIAENLRINVEEIGCQVIDMADNGREAVEKALAAQPDLILMDVRLRGAMTGIDAARQIRNHSDVPIIYITAHASVLASLEMDNRCTRLGKPFSTAQLEAAIKSALEPVNGRPSTGD